jgi:hypothetical protein
VKLALSLLAAGLALAAGVPRDLMKGLESGLTKSLRTHEMEILGFPSGLYIDGVGVVFTSEISLTYAPMANPFQQVFPPEYKARVHDTELRQLPVLRAEMKRFILDASGVLDSLPAKERIIVGVKISHQIWEDRSGLPDQLVMQASKSQLADARAGKLPLNSAIQVQEQ